MYGKKKFCIKLGSILVSHDNRFNYKIQSKVHLKYPSAFSHGSAGLLKRWSAHPPPLLILGAREPHEYILREKGES